MGKIVIYNEFGSDSQPLVATTRFEMDDGKIFRITKNIVVPGITKIGTETKPGAIEAEVVADKTGQEYNIEPTTFKISGFKGGPKYDKFYAKSTEAMSGGAEGESPVITSQDIAEAREKMTAEAKKEAVEELKNDLKDERKFFEEAITTEVVSASPSANVGAQTEKFSLAVKIRAKTLSFSENDAREILKQSLPQDEDNSNLLESDSTISYLLTEPVIDEKRLKFEAKTDLKLASGIDLENFKRGALGKNESELENIIKTYPSIQRAEVNFWPFFVSRVPMDEKRVKIEVK